MKVKIKIWSKFPYTSVRMNSRIKFRNTAYFRFSAFNFAKYSSAVIFLF